MSTKPISLTDKQLVHRLYHEYHYTQLEIADIVGISQPSVQRILKQHIEDIEEAINSPYLEPQDSGCYRTISYTSDWFPQCTQQDIGNFSDPTFDAVADMEEDAPE